MDLRVAANTNRCGAAGWRKPGVRRQGPAAFVNCAGPFFMCG